MAERDPERSIGGGGDLQSTGDVAENRQTTSLLPDPPHTHTQFSTRQLQRARETRLSIALGYVWSGASHHHWLTGALYGYF